MHEARRRRDPGASPTIRPVALRYAAAFALFLLLVFLRVKDHYLTLPNPLNVELELERGEEGRADPLIVAGRTNAGDFLSVRFTDADTVRFIYDSWGYPGITSEPVKVRPGDRLKLTIAMPALDRVLGNYTPSPTRTRVTCNGVIVLDVEGHYFVREARDIFFGENPIGGTACGPELRGRILAEDGAVLRGGPQGHFTLRERLFNWGRHYPGQVLALLLFSLGFALYADRIGWLTSQLRTAPSRAARHRWFVGATLAAGVFYTWLVTLGTFQFNFAEVFGSFYDYQAAGMLQGHLDVPEEAIGGEAFEARGKLYGYFGPTPALLRVPFTLTGLAFGKLSRALMLAYYVASLVAAYQILRHALQAARGGRGTADDLVPSPFATIVLVASVGLGSTLFFLGSRGLIFHEAILGGITFALWSCWCALRHLDAPAGRWWIGAFACGLLSIHTRPPTGLYALTFLGCVTLVTVYRGWRAGPGRWPTGWRRHLGIATLCLAGVLSLNGLAWLKFRHFDAAPLRISRPYTSTPERLERIDSKSFHLVNLGYNFDTYVLWPNVRLERGFPWIYLGTLRPRREFPEAKIDLPDHTLAMPYAMTSLFGLATLGCAGAALGFPGTRAAVGALWAAVLPMSVALFAAIATAQRYTGDFCPFLIGAGAYGLAALESMRSRGRAALRGLTALAAATAAAVTIAITLHYQGVTLWGVPEQTQRNYRQLRERVDAWFSPRTGPPSGNDTSARE